MAKYLRRFAFLASGIFLLLFSIYSPIAAAQSISQSTQSLPQQDTDAIDNDWVNWDPTSGTGGVNGTGGCISPLLPPITDANGFASAIDQYIAQNASSSPFIGDGNLFVLAGEKYGLNPAWVVNIARKESGFGINVPPGSNNAFGRTAVSGQPSVSVDGRSWYKYSSFADSIDPQMAYIKQVYIDEGLTTIEAITNKYAPPSENDTATYIAEMNQWIGQVIALAGSSVNCSQSSNSTLPNGSVQQLASEVLASQNLTENSCTSQDLQATASTGKPLTANLLSLLLAIAQAGFKVNLSILDSCQTSANPYYSAGRGVDISQVGATPLSGFDSSPPSQDYVNFITWVVEHAPQGTAGAQLNSPGAGELGFPNAQFSAIANQVGLPPGYTVILDRPDTTGATTPHIFIGVP